MSTHVQINNLLRTATDGWQRTTTSWKPIRPTYLLSNIRYNHPRHFALFIDYTQAYNSINMSLLYENMKRDKILTDGELDFLFCMYSKLKVRLGEACFSPKNGVP